ncbi:hypothetical protein GCM10027517_10180 [Phycicoccus ginsengisoli]
MAFWSERCSVLGSSLSFALPDLVVFGTTTSRPAARCGVVPSIVRTAPGGEPGGRLQRIFPSQRPYAGNPVLHC